MASQGRANRVAQRVKEELSTMLLFDLSEGRNRLGGSCLAQAFSRVGGEAPDIDDPAALAEDDDVFGGRPGFAGPT